MRATPAMTRIVQTKSRSFQMWRLRIHEAAKTLRQKPYPEASLSPSTTT